MANEVVRGSKPRDSSKTHIRAQEARSIEGEHKNDKSQNSRVMYLGLEDGHAATLSSDKAADVYSVVLAELTPNLYKVAETAAIVQGKRSPLLWLRHEFPDGAVYTPGNLERRRHVARLLRVVPASRSESWTKRQQRTRTDCGSQGGMPPPRQDRFSSSRNIRQNRMS